VFIQDLMEPSSYIFKFKVLIPKPTTCETAMGPLFFVWAGPPIFYFYSMPASNTNFYHLRLKTQLSDLVRNVSMFRSRKSWHRESCFSLPHAIYLSPYTSNIVDVFPHRFWGWRRVVVGWWREVEGWCREMVDLISIQIRGHDIIWHNVRVASFLRWCEME
jgi:hypothetical protein